MRSLIALSLTIALAGQAGGALANPPAKTLRLIGEAPSAPDPAPKTFVIDLTVSRGDSDAQTSLEGWLASTTAPASFGEVSGACVEAHCTLTADLGGPTLTLTGDFGAAAGPEAARFTLKDDDKLVGEGAATLKPLGEVAGLGTLADPGAVSAAEFDDLLVWSHAADRGGSPPGDEPPTRYQRGLLATWQAVRGRPATGLIFTADLDQLRASEAAAKKAAGWTALGDTAHGWSAGYPAALLPRASRATGKAGPEQRFASADGTAVLVVAVGPPMSDDDFAAFVRKITADPGSDASVTNEHADLQVRSVEGGMVKIAAFYNRKGGLARLEFTYPDKGGGAYAPYEIILPRCLAVTDDLKP